ncbi:uncharacterized protein LOC120343116 [Styela clava]
MLSRFLSIFIVVGLVASVRSLKCQEGVNATFGTIPFYQWTERICYKGSECFSQEIAEPFMKNMKASVQYGGCISSSYAGLITCENLFGPESTFNPAVLMNMFTDLDDMVDDMVKDFQADSIQRLKMLFSNGDSMLEFIDGIYKYLEAMGFNMAKAEPLKTKLADLFMKSFGQGEGSYGELEISENQLMDALGKLDTKNPKIAANIFSYLENIQSPEDIEIIKSNPDAALITNLPGLIKSMLPDSWEVDKWYDIIFDIFGDIKFRSPEKSTADVIKTIKMAAGIPEDYKKYLDPIFDTLPSLVQHLSTGDFSYAQTWSLQLLQAESTTNENTTKLTNAINSFIGKVVPPQTAVKPLITHLAKWLPGLFYNFFPANKDDIGRVYIEMANGFDSFDFQTPTTTLEKTELSEFLMMIINKVNTSPEGAEPDPAQAMIKLFTVNFSKTFYNLMTSKYTEDLDKFFRTLKDGFKEYPKINAGKIIVDLVTNMGETVPTEIEPILNNAQNVINAMSISDYHRRNSALYDVFSNLIGDYKTNYPDSEFPKLAENYLQILQNYDENFPKYTCFKLYETGESLSEIQPTDIEKCVRENDMKMREHIRDYYDSVNDCAVDLYFAMFEYGEKHPDVQPYLLMPLEFQEPYVNIIRLLDRQDVKDLIRDYTDWMYNMSEDPSLNNFDAFIHSVNATVYKITSKLSSAMKDLREFHRPHSCKYTSCSSDLCNSHERITNIVPYTRPSKKITGDETITSEPTSTTSGSGNVVTTVLLNVASLCLAYKTLSE